MIISLFHKPDGRKVIFFSCFRNPIQRTIAIDSDCCILNLRQNQDQIGNMDHHSSCVQHLRVFISVLIWWSYPFLNLYDFHFLILSLKWHFYMLQACLIRSAYHAGVCWDEFLPDLISGKSARTTTTWWQLQLVQRSRDKNNNLVTTSWRPRLLQRVKVKAG